MKVAICADVHLGNHKRFGGPVVGSINTRAREGLDVFKAAVQHAVDTDCDTFVVAGDLFDYARPEPAILAAVQGIMRQAVELEFYVLVGNHDRTSTAHDDNALAPLAPYATVVETPLVVGDMVLVPFQAGVASEWLPQVLSSLMVPVGGLLVLHMGIRDDKTPPWLRESAGAIPAKQLLDLCVQHAFEAAVAGDWHEHRAWKRGDVRAMQIGALVPTGWDNPGFDGYGSVITWERAAMMVRSEIAGPRFVKVRNDEERSTACSFAKKHRVYVAEVAPPDALEETRRAATSLAEQVGFAGLEVLPDEQIAKAEAKLAGSVAKSAETLDEALANYVAAMHLPEDVDRAQVLARCKEFMA